MRNVAAFRKAKGYSCLICNCKEEDKMQEMSIKRHCLDGNVIKFDICDDCLKQLGKDVSEYLTKIK